MAAAGPLAVRAFIALRTAFVKLLLDMFWKIERGSPIVPPATAKR